MRRIIVDSGSSIKMNEKEQYGVDILPIQLQMGEDSFLDGVNLSIDEFLGKLLSIIPIISFINGRVEVLLKKRGIKQCKRTVVEMIQADQADKDYGIIAAYTYNKENVDDMIRMLPEDYQNAISVYDDLCSSIACHWGPNAFGFIYVKGIDVV